MKEKHRMKKTENTIRCAYGRGSYESGDSYAGSDGRRTGTANA